MKFGRVLLLVIACGLCLPAGAMAGTKPTIAEAIQAGNLRVVREMLAANPDIIHLRFGNNHEPILSFAMHTEPYPKLELLKALIDAGADVNAASQTTGFSPLMEGADHCHVGASDFLLNKYDAEPDVVANDGTTALIAATFSACPGVVDLLIKSCARLDAKYKGAYGPETALEIAHSQDHPDFYDYPNNKKVLKLLEDAHKATKCPSIRKARK